MMFWSTDIWCPFLLLCTKKEITKHTCHSCFWAGLVVNFNGTCLATDRCKKQLIPFRFNSHEFEGVTFIDEGNIV